MQSLEISAFVSFRYAWTIAAMLNCVFLVGAQSGFAESLHNSGREGVTIVERKQIEKTIAGSYHYQSNYEMTKDQSGNYQSTYQSDKKEWFCCFHLFSSEKAVSIKSDKP